MEGHIQETDESISTKPSLAQLPQSALLCVEMFQAPFKGDPASGESATRGHCWNKDTTASLATGFKFLQGELKSKGYERDQSLPL